MPHVVVLATGGTIASTADASGAAVASRTAGELLREVADASTAVESRDIFNINSFLLTHRDLRVMCEAVARELARDEVDGVVLTHGTDTMEESAFLLDLVHASDKPVVLTGAQRAADAAGGDGPQHLRDSIAVAGDAAARGRGVMICFAGQVLAARGTRKVHTLAPAPFATAEGGPIGTLGGGKVRFHLRPEPRPVQGLPTEAFDRTRVDVLSVYPGADASLAQAAVDAGAAGVVIAGSGVGNGNHALVQWVEQAVASGIPVGLSTRAAEGTVLPVYGNGGSHDMVRAGALPYGSLPLYQARLLAAYLISNGTPPTGELIAPYV